MKKYIFLLLIYLIANSMTAIACDKAILCDFIEYIGESPAQIEQIMSSRYADNPMNTLDVYLSLKYKLEYDSMANELKWKTCWEDSIFLCKCIEFISNKILNDTALDFIDKYLLESYVTHHEYEEKIILDCAIKSIEKYRSRSALIIPELYYYNNHNKEGACNAIMYFFMIKYIILGGEHLFCIDCLKNICVEVKQILCNTDDKSYYNIYRKMMSNFSDMDLAKLSKDHIIMIENTLIKGVQAGEPASALTYSFMLITGCILDKDYNKGFMLLSKHLPISLFEEIQVYL